MSSVSETGARRLPRAGVDPAIFRALYEQHADGLFGYFARRVGSDLAEDLLAETFHEAIESYGSFDGRCGSERAWLFGIGSNLLRHHWRTEQRRLRALARDGARPATSIDPLLAVGDHVADHLDAVAMADRVIDALDALSPEDRTLLFLAGWEHLNSTEIGAAIGMHAATVRTPLNPAAGLEATTTATIGQLVHGTAGRFINIEIPAGEVPPRLRFQSGDNVFDTNPPPSPSSYDF